MLKTVNAGLRVLFTIKGIQLPEKKRKRLDPGDPSNVFLVFLGELVESPRIEW